MGLGESGVGVGILRVLPGQRGVELRRVLLPAGLSVGIGKGLGDPLIVGHPLVRGLILPDGRGEFSRFLVGPAQAEADHGIVRLELQRGPVVRDGVVPLAHLAVEEPRDGVGPRILRVELGDPPRQGKRPGVILPLDVASRKPRQGRHVVGLAGKNRAVLGNGLVDLSGLEMLLGQGLPQGRVVRVHGKGFLEGLRLPFRIGRVPGETEPVLRRQLDAHGHYADLLLVVSDPDSGLRQRPAPQSLFHGRGHRRVHQLDGLEQDLEVIRSAQPVHVHGDVLLEKGVRGDALDDELVPVGDRERLCRRDAFLLAVSLDVHVMKGGRLSQQVHAHEPPDPLDGEDLAVDGDQDNRPHEDQDADQRGPDEDHRTARLFSALPALPPLFLLVIVHGCLFDCLPVCRVSVTGLLSSASCQRRKAKGLR